jgi:uncharacterized protein YndB with AHSA1/START domain
MSRDRIEVEIVYPHPRARVWAALTRREALAAWLMDNDFEPRVGHRFRFTEEGARGWSGVVECEVVELREPEVVAMTWKGDPKLPATLVRFTLADAPGGTRLRLEHSGFGAGGLRSLLARAVLGLGWRRKVLRKNLPDYLGASS